MFALFLAATFPSCCNSDLESKGVHPHHDTRIRFHREKIVHQLAYLAKCAGLVVLIVAQA